MDWQPIETAPRDGTLVDLWCIRTNEYGGVDERRYPNCKWGAPYNQILQRDDPEQWLGIKEMYATAVPTHWMLVPGSPND